MTVCQKRFIGSPSTVIGSKNLIVGSHSIVTGNPNRVIGSQSDRSGSQNRVDGSHPDRSVSQNRFIGNILLNRIKIKSGLMVIDQNRQVQEVDSTGLTKNKAELRANLIEIILQVSAALMAHATAVKDIALKTKANYSTSDLRNSADPVLFDIGALLLGLANTVKTELVKYAIDEEALKAMDTLLGSFKLAVPRRRVAASESKTSTLNIDTIFKAQDKLLKDEIDALMLPFRFTQPDFYNAYKNARSIIGYTGRGKSVPEPQTEKTV